MLILMVLICTLPILWVTMSLFELRRGKCMSGMRQPRISRR